MVARYNIFLKVIFSDKGDFNLANIKRTNLTW